MRKTIILAILLLAAGAWAQIPAPLQPQEGDFILKDFHFQSGETLPVLKIHYYTLGTPKQDRHGEVKNAVLLLHGTGGSGRNYLGENFTQVLFGPGEPLDARQYFIILPDGIGHGGSSKPSDGLHLRFPRYQYADMVEAQYRLVSEGLGIHHLRLVGGISMGGMHTWMWGEEHPQMMDALLPLVSLPVEIAGRNRMWRKFCEDLITGDPAWEQGEYKQEPPDLKRVAEMFAIVVSGPANAQQQAATGAAAEKLLAEVGERYAAHMDANDILYALRASWTYNPWPKLETIRARMTAVNAADDFINPPDLGVMDQALRRVPHLRYVLIKVSEGARGHGTSGATRLWAPYVAELLKKK